MTSLTQKPERFLNLDLLRGIAALAVAMRHLPGAPLKHVLPGSYLAVDLFFALSGFVLAHAYLKRFAQGMTLAQFLKLRAARLYPLYALATLIGAALALPLAITAGKMASWYWTIGVGLPGLPVPEGLSLSRHHPFPFTYPAWSLFWEIAVNVVFVLLALRLTVRLHAAILAIGAGLLVWSTWLYGSLNTGAFYANFIGGGMRVIYSFFIGAALYHVWHSGRLDRLRAVPGSLAVPLSIALMLAAFMVDPGVHRAMFDLAMVLIVFPVLIALATGPTPAWLLWASATLGAASYPLYVLHVPLMRAIGKIGRALGMPPETFGPVLMTASIVAVFLISAGPAQWFDARARRVMQRMLSPRRKIVPA